MEKRCSECGEPKLAAHFYKNRTNKDGLFGKCKVCSEGTKKERALNEVTVDSKVCFHLLLAMPSSCGGRAADIYPKVMLPSASATLELLMSKGCV